MSKQLESILKRAPRAMVDHAMPAAVGVATEEPQAVVRVQPHTVASVLPKVAADRQREVSLGIEVPESVKRAVSIKAATEGITNRTLLLRALVGIGIDVDDVDLRDRRK